MHATQNNVEELKEKVSCEIRELPSMMWKGSIVQAKASCARAAAALGLGLFVFVWLCGCGHCADLVIEIPGSGAGGEAEGGVYRLDYRPPQGSPPPNHTVPARASTINFQGLPGTKYHFMLYYSNATFADLLTWNQTIITAPEPPTNLTVTLGRNKQATIGWSPPAHGDYTGFRFKVIPLTERAEGGARNITVEGAGNWTHTLRDLSPGATYQLHAFTLLHDKESAAYASRNFTTRPNTPGKFIVWFRNETTLLVLWQPPYPPGAYTHYKVSIVPPDARDSEQYVEKEGEPPGPAQAAFKGLVPGRAYNISVQTVSEPEISAPTTAQYRTVPLRPRNVTAPPHLRTETAFTVTWLPPNEESEFEKYQVSVSGAGLGAGGGGARRLAPAVRPRDAPPAAAFDGLEPGAHYTVTVKTMSGKVTSWPASADLTLKPLPVRAVEWRRVEGSEGILLSWVAPAGSTQDEYKVSYHEAGPSRDDSNTLATAATNVTLDSLLPGRNYTVTVCSVSRGVESNESSVAVTTRPLAPVVLAAAAGAGLRVAWRSDVNSRQQLYMLRYARRRPAPEPPAADYVTLETTETNATLNDLYPGAVYEVGVAAVSHGLASEWHTVYKPVRPLAAEWLRVERASSNALRARWEGPARGALGAFHLQYRADTPTDRESAWVSLPPLGPSARSAELPGLAPGERYQVRLDTASEAAAGGPPVTSDHPRDVYHVVRPSPVSNVAALVDTRNMTLEWPRPAGRVEFYSLRWWRADNASGAEGGGGARNVSAAGAGGAGAGRVARALVAALAPGAPYTVTIAAISYDLVSDLFTMDTRTRPLILSEMTIVTESGNDDDNETDASSAFLKVQYTPTPESATTFDSYRFRLEGEGEPAASARLLERPAPATPRQVLFQRLVPGRLYNVTMWTVSRNVTSHPVARQARLYPRAAAWLRAAHVGARGVALAWGAPPGDATDYELQYLAAAHTLRTDHTPATAYNLTGLRPHTNYTFTVVVRAGTPDTLLALSRTRSVEVTTLEAPPDAPLDFRVVDATPNSLTFAWDMPEEARHGELRRFLLTYGAVDGAGDAPPTEVELGAGARRATAAGLAAGALYRCTLRAETGAGAGAAAVLAQRAPIAAPPAPPAAAAPRPLRQAPTTVAVRFRADAFSHANGNVTAYTLVLAEEPRADAPPRLPSWRDVHRLPVWPPYQVTEPYYPFHSSAVEEFTIGSERCEGGGRSYCNGPLKPATTYYVKLRAFTAPDKFTDTAYAVIHTGTPAPRPAPPRTPFGLGAGIIHLLSHT